MSKAKSLSQQPPNDCEDAEENSAKESQQTVELTLELSKVLASVIDLGNKYAKLHDERNSDCERIRTLQTHVETLNSENTQMQSEIKHLTGKFNASLSNAESNVKDLTDQVAQLAVQTYQSICVAQNAQLLANGQNPQENTKTTVSDEHPGIDSISLQDGDDTELNPKPNRPPSPTFAEVVKNGRQTLLENRKTTETPNPENEVTTTKPINNKNQPTQPNVPVSAKESQNMNTNSVLRLSPTSGLFRRQLPPTDMERSFNTQSNLTCNDDQPGNKIETRITTQSSDSKRNAPQTTPENACSKFKGKYRGRLKTYYVGGIDPKSTVQGLAEYLEERSVSPIETYVFLSRSGNLAAKVSVPHYQAHMLQCDEFWPRFVRCRQWLSRNSWDKYRQSADTNSYRDYDAQNNYDHNNVEQSIHRIDY
ncbi:MAG: hypothetical protein ABW185_19830 [Sedimenticola sp.]